MKRGRPPYSPAENDARQRAIDVAMLAALMIGRSGGRDAARTRTDADNMRRAVRLAANYFASVDQRISAGTLLRYWHRLGPRHFTVHALVEYPLTIRFAADLLRIDDDPRIDAPRVDRGYVRHLKAGGAHLPDPFDIAREFHRTKLCLKK